MKEQMIKEELDKLGISLNTEFTARVIKVHEVYFTNDIESIKGYFKNLEDARNYMEQLPGFTECRDVLDLIVNDQFILLSKMKKIELQPAGSVPHLSLEEMAKLKRERIIKLVDDFDKKMPEFKKPLLSEDKRKLSPEELQFILENIEQGPK